MIDDELDSQIEMFEAAVAALADAGRTLDAAMRRRELWAVVDAARKMQAARERKAVAGRDLREAIVAEQRLYDALDVLMTLASDEAPDGGERP